MTKFKDPVLLRYQSGDFVPMEAISYPKINASTSSGTFTAADGATDKCAHNLDKFPSDATLQARLNVVSGSTMDTDGNFRINFKAQGGGSNEQGSSLTISSGDTFTWGSGSTFTVSLREGVEVVVETQSSDGTNSVTCFNASVELGLQMP